MKLFAFIKLTEYGHRSYLIEAETVKDAWLDLIRSQFLKSEEIQVDDNLEFSVDGCYINEISVAEFKKAIETNSYSTYPVNYDLACYQAMNL